jgi:phosphatidylinositol alpha 1,6-mannosyltransferase
LKHRLELGPLRVALFPDSFEEPNGVATLCRHLTRYADDRKIPLLVVRGADETSVTHQRSITTVKLKRSIASFPVDKDLYCDPLLTRYRDFVVDELVKFDPDVVHITGPGDLGFLGLLTAHVAGVTLAASWHTNLHEYASRRLCKTFSFAPRALRARIGAFSEHHCLRGLIRFYRMPHFLMAPNQATIDLLESRARRPARLMAHGVDTSLFTPLRRVAKHDRFCIGYVGRLTPEKNVRAFAAIEKDLIARGHRDFKLLLIGEGSERDWLKRHLQFGELPGVLRGEQLADAYARMDAFVFPSHTDTFGLVLLEALASGIPVVTSPSTGARAGLEEGVSAVFDEDLARGIIHLKSDPLLLKSMSRAARQFACSRDWSHAFDHLYRTYREGLEIEDKRASALKRAMIENQLTSAG